VGGVTTVGWVAGGLGRERHIRESEMNKLIRTGKVYTGRVSISICTVEGKVSQGEVDQTVDCGAFSTTEAKAALTRLFLLKP
jgi:hypothetical protein